MLRKPKIEAPKTEELKQKNFTTWHTMQCKLVTPMYGGGVQSHTIDKDMPIRVSGIRGQLRFWWRLLAKHKWGLDNIAIRQQEFALWGGSDDKNPQASLVFLKISDTEKLSKYAKTQNNCVPHSSYYIGDKQKNSLPYVFFAADNETDPNVEHKVLKEGLQFELAFKFAQKTNHTQQSQVIETLRWWANFGGVGARTRRGLGSVQVIQCKDFSEIIIPLTAKEVAEADCQLAIAYNEDGKNKNVKKDDSHIITCWRNAVNKLKDFRQGENVGRITKYGASLWTEANNIRKLNNISPIQTEYNHIINIYPRSHFGLPIIFNMPHDKKISNFSFMLCPDNGATKKENNIIRLASPLILRAFLVSTKNEQNIWKPAALLLPTDYLQDLKLRILVNRKGEREQVKHYKDIRDWSDKGKNIKAIQDNGGGTPLEAFMRFFAN